jgi:tetratricopeptide (TPR) repeat protein
MPSVPLFACGRRRPVRGGLPAIAAASAVAIAVSLGLAGCGPSEEEIRLHRAMYEVRSTPNPDMREAIGTLAVRRESDKHKSEFVQYSMCEITAATMAGYYEHADRVGKHAYLAVQRYQDADEETRAAWGNEAVKFFKGEPHERAMLCFYTGLMCYRDGDYNNARVFFAQSLRATASRDEDMKDHRDDFRLGHLWLGRAFLKLGQRDNACIAFRKVMDERPLPSEVRDFSAMKRTRTQEYKTQLTLEKKCYEQGAKGKNPVHGIVNLADPVQRADMPARLPHAADGAPTHLFAAELSRFLDPDFQSAANLLLVVELGAGPTKYLHGASDALDDYRRTNNVARGVDVYLDGFRAGPAFCLADMYHQAITRGVKTRRGRQVGKAVTKEILRRTPWIGGVFSYWDIAADGRYWPSLPDQVAVYAACVEPGFHDISLKFYDINGAYLPRFDINRHYIYVPEQGEQVILLHSAENQENAHILAQPLAKK